MCVSTSPYIRLYLYRQLSVSIKGDMHFKWGTQGYGRGNFSVVISTNLFSDTLEYTFINIQLLTTFISPT